MESKPSVQGTACISSDFKLLILTAQKQKKRSLSSCFRRPPSPLSICIHGKAFPKKTNRDTFFFMCAEFFSRRRCHHCYRRHRRRRRRCAAVVASGCLFLRKLLCVLVECCSAPLQNYSSSCLLVSIICCWCCWRCFCAASPSRATAEAYTPVSRTSILVYTW